MDGERMLPTQQGEIPKAGGFARRWPPVGPAISALTSGCPQGIIAPENPETLGHLGSPALGLTPKPTSRQTSLYCVWHLLSPRLSWPSLQQPGMCRPNLTALPWLNPRALSCSELCRHLERCWRKLPRHSYVGASLKCQGVSTRGANLNQQGTWGGMQQIHAPLFCLLGWQSWGRFTYFHRGSPREWTTIALFNTLWTGFSSFCFIFQVPEEVSPYAQIRKENFLNLFTLNLFISSLKHLPPCLRIIYWG